MQLSFPHKGYKLQKKIIFRSDHIEKGRIVK